MLFKLYVKRRNQQIVVHITVIFWILINYIVSFCTQQHSKIKLVTSPLPSPMPVCVCVWVCVFDPRRRMIHSLKNQGKKCNHQPLCEIMVVGVRRLMVNAVHHHHPVNIAALQLVYYVYIFKCSHSFLFRMNC